MNETRIQRDGRGHVRRSAQERQKLIEAYRNSGMGKADFCRLHQINLGTFCGWFKKKPGFIEVNLPPSEPHRGPRPAGLELDLPGGLCVRVYDGRLLKTLGPFIRKVLAC